MKRSAKDQIKGELHGKAKEKCVGSRTDMVAEGQSEKLAGKIQKNVGRIKKMFGNQ
jgi:uncharacterized protein YjbJ (UPF0337 family)